MDKHDLEKGHSEGGDNDELKVSDRRLFDSEGRLRQELETEPGEEPPSTGPLVGAEAGFERKSLEEPEGVDFIMLINAMAQPALIYLGEIAHPGTGKPEINLEQARLNIDMLALLRVKCRGNLTHDEEALLDGLLYQLQMRYVAKSDAASPA